MPIFLLFLATVAAAEDRKTAALAPFSLAVMSYNIKGLPSPIIGSEYKDERYGVIGKILKREGQEIVLLQEAFSEQSKILLDSAAYPHLAAGPGASSFFGVNSGLYILSKYPILEQANATFGEDCLSWDCLANKGVQFARIAVPGLPLPLEVFNTHMQAGRSDTTTRRKQVAVLLAFFKTHHKEGSPVIFGGDFNFRPGLGHQSYLDFAEGSGLVNAAKFCLESGCAPGEQQGERHGIWERAVDHQFYSSTGPVRLVPKKIERRFREPVDELRLSDHPTHEVRYEFTPPRLDAAKSR